MVTYVYLNIEFLFKNNKPDKALEIFKIFSIKYANKVEIFYGLGKVYLLRSNYLEAKKAFQKAV